MDVHILDDDEGVRSILATLMQALGYCVKTFSGPEEYLAFMRDHGYSPPRLSILSDVDMPGMSGYELMQEVRMINPQQRFIMITGGQRSAPEDDYPCFYFIKPVSLKQMEKAFGAQSLCTDSSPDASCRECASIGDRLAFGIKDWHCPLVAS